MLHESRGADVLPEVAGVFCCIAEAPRVTAGPRWTAVAANMTDNTKVATRIFPAGPGGARGSPFIQILER